jgi:broad specificity phosphatase PhoE
MIRITLVRHGKPAFELKGSVRAKDLGKIAKSYDLSGIVDTPPRETLAAARGNHFVICSDLTRSIESAKALGCPEVHATDPLFCESALPHFDGGSITLPISVWIVVLRLMWVFGFSRNGESLGDLRKRARQASTRLIELAEQHHDVLLVGHGFVNHFIAKELRRYGWLGPSKPAKGYWGYGSYERASA